MQHFSAISRANAIANSSISSIGLIPSEQSNQLQLGHSQMVNAAQNDLFENPDSDEDSNIQVHRIKSSVKKLNDQSHRQISSLYRAKLSESQGKRQQDGGRERRDGSLKKKQRSLSVLTNV